MRGNTLVTTKRGKMGTGVFGLWSIAPLGVMVLHGCFPLSLSILLSLASFLCFLSLTLSIPLSLSFGGYAAVVFLARPLCLSRSVLALAKGGWSWSIIPLGG